MRGYLPPTLIALLLQASYTTVLAASSSKSDEHKDLKPCTIYDPSRGHFYDLNTITVHPLVDHKKAHKDDRDASWYSRGYDYGVNFTMNFCAPVIEHLEHVEGLKKSEIKNISAFYTTEDQKIHSIG